MDYFYEPNEAERVAHSREGFSGRLLSDTQFDEFMGITRIVELSIKTQGAYTDKLTDYAYAVARTNKLDPGRAEIIIRDLFKERTGLTPNQMLQGYRDREESLTKEQKSLALGFARAVGAMIRGGDKISFSRSYAHQAQELAGELGITHVGAKRLMKEEFAAVEDRDLYEVGKELEGQFFRPQIEAEKEARERTRDRDQSSESSARNRTMNGSGGRRSYQPRIRP
ncbi:hypothetical protein [Mesorhizobium sp. CN2-181]|uniref:hypothetical protein n=1 Tax=Mesorhizobium yinganensis TaxID=3157707 RepID=UPI0032B728CC